MTQADDDLVRRALRAAETFIVNGVAFGFIRMPDPSTPDPAHDTLPLVRAALAGISQKKSSPVSSTLSESLVERLRSASKSLDRPPSVQSISNLRIIEACDEAAAHIDAQAARIAELESENERLNCAWTRVQNIRLGTEDFKRADRLEALLRDGVYDPQIVGQTTGAHHFRDTQASRGWLYRVWRELEGSTDADIEG